MEAFGGISAISMYNTYLGIGAVADAYSVDKYKSDYVQTLMNEQIGMIDAVNEMLEKVVNDKSGNVPVEDQTYINNIVKTFSYLKDEAIGLRDYSKNEDTISSEKYETNRKLAWEMISELLGFNE